MTFHNDSVYLQSILDSITKINCRACSGAEPEMVFESVVFHLITIGEAASKLSPELKNLHREIPWPQIIAHRNVLVHNYLGIDEEIVWNVVRLRLPELKSAIMAIIDKQGAASE